MRFLDQEIRPLGMGCWPIGGPMFSGDQPLGYAKSEDRESVRTIHAALSGGITLFDTAAVYGAGHAERLLARALKGRPDALVVTKIGTAIDEQTKQLTGDEIEPETVLPAIDRCLARLERDRIDLLLLHQNDLPVPQAEAMFDEMEKAVKSGKVRAYGWSTDFAESVTAVASRQAFVAVEHAMNVLVSPPRIQSAVRANELTALIRSPLAMGLLTGKFEANTVMPSNDIRGTSNPKTAYFVDAKPNPTMLTQFDAVRDLLRADGRSQTQGAICWLWSKGENVLPVPGARTVEQIEDLAEALAFGALPETVMTEIEAIIEREPDSTPDRAM